MSDIDEPDTFMRDAEVTAATGIPRYTRYELIEKGLFPAQIRLSPRIVAWSGREIAQWQRERMAERDAKGE
jgi:predicted DNA-binding transcriptional regulator AlpA